MGRLAKITISVTSVVSASYACQILFPFITPNGGGYAHLGLLNGPALSSFQLFIVALAIAFLHAGVVNQLFASRLRRSVREARAREKSRQNKMVAQELV